MGCEGSVIPDSKWRKIQKGTFGVEVGDKKVAIASASADKDVPKVHPELLFYLGPLETSHESDSDFYECNDHLDPLQMKNCGLKHPKHEGWAELTEAQDYKAL